MNIKDSYYFVPVRTSWIPENDDYRGQLLLILFLFVRREYLRTNLFINIKDSDYLFLFLRRGWLKNTSKFFCFCFPY